MKVKSISILIIFFICSSFKFQEKQLETGWYFIAQNNKLGISFEDRHTHENYTVEKHAIVNISDFKSVKLTEEKMPGLPKFKKLKIKLTSDGNKKWELATDEMSSKNKSVIFVFKNLVLCHLTVIDKAGNISPSIVDNDLNSPELQSVYDSMPENIKK